MTPAQRKAAALTIASALAVPAEGLRQWAYRDPVGLPTICFGSTQGVQMGDFRTVPECKALLTKEMLYAVQTVDSCRPGLPINVLAAFSDLSYNVGSSVACDATKSTAAKLLASGDYPGACKQILRWTKAKVMGVYVDLPGLVKRRKMEYEVCMSGISR